MVIRYVVLTLLMCGLRLADAAAVDVRVEPDPPAHGESFRIAFTVQGEVANEPDFAPLEPVAEILSRNRQTSIQWINGAHTRTTTWVLEVIAKVAGPLVIPAIIFGKSTSAPHTIRISDSSPGADDNGLFLEVDASPRDPYVQEQVIYTIRLWRRFELSNASLSEPHLSRDAIVRPLGEDRQLSMEKNGKAYEVIERRFALFPQASGEVQIAPSTVTAQVLTRSFSLFDMFGQSVKTRRVTSEPVILKVRPVPDAFPANGNWLPASKVRVNEEWNPATLEAKVGEPLTRTLTLWAEGLTSGQLPNFRTALPATLKAYPDQPSLKDDSHAETLTAVHQEKLALIPTAAGTIVLPAVTVPWWNTTTDKFETARLPARTITALPAAGDSPPPAPMPSAAAPVMPESRSVPLVIATPRGGFMTWPGWFWVAVTNLGAWLFAVWWFLRRLPRRDPDTALDPERVSVRAARALVASACRQHDPAAARRALLAWAAAKWPEFAPNTLSAIAVRAGPLASAIADLNRALYQPGAPAWDSGSLARAFDANTGESPPASLPLPHLFKLVRE